jgi:hypothetical protein
MLMLICAALAFSPDLTVQTCGHNAIIQHANIKKLDDRTRDVQRGRTTRRASRDRQLYPRLLIGKLFGHFSTAPRTYLKVKPFHYTQEGRSFNVRTSHSPTTNNNN